MRKMTTSDFISKSIKVHGNIYDYSKSVFTGAEKKLIITCKIHGDFEQRANVHYRGYGCPSCTNNKKCNTQTFIEKAIKAHGNVYDYSKVNYVNNKTPIIIGCRIHGDFEQRPDSHVNRKTGCLKCKHQSMYSNTNDFIQKSKYIHGDVYDYSKVNYVNNITKVEIGCNIHGYFLQTPQAHLNSNGCVKCGQIERVKKISLQYEDFIKRSNKIHNNIYDYSKINNIESGDDLVIIGCSKHGDFIQKAQIHINGSGCSMCCSSRSEKKIISELENRSIKYYHQYRFNDCRYKNSLPFDFYLPDYNICIEYDGIQHDTIIEHWGGKDGYEYRKNNDLIKTKYCIKNNIMLIRINYNMNISEEIEKIFKTK